MSGSGIAVGGAVRLLAAPGGRGLCGLPVASLGGGVSPSPSHARTIRGRHSFLRPSGSAGNICRWESWVSCVPSVVGRDPPYSDTTAVVTAGKFWAQNSVFNDTRERLTRKLLRILKMEGASHVFRSLEAVNMTYLSEDKINWIVR